MTACFASPTKSRKLQSFIVLVSLYILFYTYIRTSGKCLSNLGEAEYRIADALTGFHYDAIVRWRHFRPELMFRHGPKKEGLPRIKVELSSQFYCKLQFNKTGALWRYKSQPRTGHKRNVKIEM